MAVIEISLDSVESAQAAETGGASRVELCSGLSEGGLTPSLGLFRRVRACCGLKMYVIVRPRGGDFLYSDEEFCAMQEDIRILSGEGADGFVFGLLTAAGEVDVDRTRVLVELAAPHEVTFHRAIDMTVNPVLALEDVIRCGARRVLSSGGAADAWSGRATLRTMVERAKGRITIIAGGGVRPERLSELAEETGVVEFHSSMRTIRESAMIYQARGLWLGERGRDEYTRTIVVPEEVRRLVMAARVAR